MSANQQAESHLQSVSTGAEKSAPKGASRRAFLGHVGGMAATVAAGALTAGASAAAAGQGISSVDSSGNGRLRALECFNNRVSAAQAELNVRIPNEVTNGDEQRFSNRIGNYSKGLVHNAVGEVDSSSYASYLRAINGGDPRLFEQIQMGGNAPLIDPQAGLAFDLEGTDSHQLAIGTPPSITSPEIAAAAVENYWMALCRDINFTQYGNEPLTAAAIAELNSLSGFHGPSRSRRKTCFEASLPVTWWALTFRNFCCSLSTMARFPLRNS